MVGWQQWFDGHEFEQALGVGDGQRSLAAAVLGITKSWTQLSDWTELDRDTFYLCWEPVVVWAYCEHLGWIHKNLESNTTTGIDQKSSNRDWWIQPEKHWTPKENLMWTLTASCTTKIQLLSPVLRISRTIINIFKEKKNTWRCSHSFSERNVQYFTVNIMATCDTLKHESNRVYTTSYSLFL